MSLPKTVPVGTADAGAFFNNEVLAAVDYGMSNVHPWFANVSIDDAAAWTYEFFQENNIAAAQALSNKPQMFIAETGWPTVSLPPCMRLPSLTHLQKSSDAGNANNGPSLASTDNLQVSATVLDGRGVADVYDLFRNSLTPSCANLTRTARATSISSTSTSNGRMPSSVVLKDGGACSTKSAYSLYFLRPLPS